jgi:hypothetical protein
MHSLINRILEGWVECCRLYNHIYLCPPGRISRAAKYTGCDQSEGRSKDTANTPKHETSHLFQLVKNYCPLHYRRVQVSSLANRISSMAFILLLIFLIAFIYAVVGVNLFYNYAHSPRTDLQYQFYFKNIGSIIQVLVSRKRR